MTLGHWTYSGTVPDDFYGFVYLITNTLTDRKYCGSSNNLLQDIELLGKDKFKFEIIQFYGSKSELSYFEAKLQFENDVLLREDYYNGIINVRVGKIKGCP
jgi:hypothetical protein